MPELLPKELIDSQNNFFLPQENSIFTRPGLVLNRAMETLDIDSFAYSVNHYLKEQGKEIIYFSDIGESFEPRFLNLTNCVVSKLLNDYNMDRKNMKFLSGADPNLYNYQIYNVHTQKNNWTRLDATLANNFETLMAKYVKDRELSDNNFLTYKNRSYNRPKVFLFMNGGARLHRLYLFCYIVANDLLDKGYVSLHSPRSIINYLLLNLELEKKRLPSLMELLRVIDKTQIELPRILTANVGDHKAQHSISPADLNLFDSSYFSIVAETCYFEKFLICEGDLYNAHLESIFFTEKIYRALACQHPFLLVGRPHSLKYLRAAGYQTFSPYIDETYDDIENDHDRILKIAEIIKKLCNKKQSFWHSFVEVTNPIVKHNYEVLKNQKPRFFTHEDYLKNKPTLSGI